MADGGGTVKQFTTEVTQAAEEVIKDVKDSVGQALEQGVQSVVGTQLNQQQIQQKQIQDQRDLAEARRKIEWLKGLGKQQKIVRQQEKQKQQQRKPDEVQEQQKEKVEQMQIQQTSKRPGEILREDIARSQMERSKGRGVGG